MSSLRIVMIPFPSTKRQDLAPARWRRQAWKPVRKRRTPTLARCNGRIDHLQENLDFYHQESKKVKVFALFPLKARFRRANLTCKGLTLLQPIIVGNDPLALLQELSMVGLVSHAPRSRGWLAVPVKAVEHRH